MKRISASPFSERSYHPWHGLAMLPIWLPARIITRKASETLPLWQDADLPFDRHRVEWGSLLPTAMGEPEITRAAMAAPVSPLPREIL